MTTSATVPNTGAQSAANPLKGLLAYGQSPWMDYIRRDLLTGGGLKKFIAEDGLRGQTSNPTIFEKAINGSTLYSDILNSPEAKSLNAKQLYEKIAIRDVQDACDIFRSVYDESKHRDGYVSLEVSPFLANDTNGTIEEARRLWKSVNLTLLFAQSAYEKVAEAFIAALEARAAKGQPVNHIASVASFFVSRIDTLIDGKIDAMLKTASGDAKTLLESLHGTIAIANAKLTYKKYQELFGGPRWQALAAKGAQTQRLLWASTSTKCFPRPRQASRQPHRRCPRCSSPHGKSRQGRNLHEGSHRTTHPRRRKTFCRSL